MPEADDVTVDVTNDIAEADQRGPMTGAVVTMTGGGADTTVTRQARQTPTPESGGPGELPPSEPARTRSRRRPRSNRCRRILREQFPPGRGVLIGREADPATMTTASASPVPAGKNKPEWNSGGPANSELHLVSVSAGDGFTATRLGQMPLVHGASTIVFTAGPTHLRSPACTPRNRAWAWWTAPAMISGTTRTQGCRCSPESQKPPMRGVGREILRRDGYRASSIPSSAQAAGRPGWSITKVQPQTRQRLRPTLVQLGVSGMRAGVAVARHQSAAPNRRVRGSVPDRLSRRSTHDRGRGGATRCSDPDQCSQPGFWRVVLPR